MSNIILTIVTWVIYRFKEHTPPDIKHSERNYRVAKAALAIEDLRKFLTAVN